MLFMLTMSILAEESEGFFVLIATEVLDVSTTEKKCL